MTKESDTHGKPPAPTSRENRLKAALKANLARRKAQARNRKADETAGKPGPTKQTE